MFGWLKEIRAQIKDLRFSVAHHIHRDYLGSDRIKMLEDEVKTMNRADLAILLRVENHQHLGPLGFDRIEMLENEVNALKDNLEAIHERVDDAEWEMI